MNAVVFLTGLRYTGVGTIRRFFALCSAVQSTLQQQVGSFNYVLYQAKARPSKSGRVRGQNIRSRQLLGRDYGARVLPPSL